MDLLHRLLRVAVGLAALALFCLPALAAFRWGWLSLGPDTSMERWTLFALLYLSWAVFVTFAVVWCNERLGIRWAVAERSARPVRRERLRMTARLRFLEGQNDARGVPARRRRGRD